MNLIRVKEIQLAAYTFNFQLELLSQAVTSRFLDLFLFETTHCRLS